MTFIKSIYLGMAMIFSCAVQAQEWPVNLLPESKAHKNLKSFLSEYNTDGMVLVKNGTIIHENYYQRFTEDGVPLIKYNKDKLHIMWSVSKSFSSALAGVAVLDGKVKINQSVCDFYTELAGTDKCRITIKNLLQYTAGINWVEEYDPEGLWDLLTIGGNDTLQLLGGPGNKDCAGYYVTRDLADEPGTALQYNTGGPCLLMGLLKKAYGTDYHNFPTQKLFSKIGAKKEHYYMLKDQSGTFMGGSNYYMTPRVMARLGQLYLQNGLWDGQQVLPKNWVGFTTQKSTATKIIQHQDVPGVDVNESIGAMWWLNKDIGEGIPWAAAPADTYVAWGHRAQFIIVIPSEKIVITRTAKDALVDFNLNEFISLSLEVAKGAK